MKETILIIEDEEDILALLSSLLESEGYTIITATNGLKGLQEFQAHKPGLILSDVRMPVMDGIEVLKKVKTRETDTEVIILTGHSDEATAIDCLRLGAYDYFRKPLEDIDVLLTAVSRVFEKRNLEQKNRSLVRQLAELSTKDPLTGLYNYRHLQTCLDEEIDRSRRYGHSFFILMIDADHFKNINDAHGHLFGDYVLKKLGQLISTELRSTDRLFRYGGEEFLVIMNELSKTEVVNAVNRQLAFIRNHTFIYEGQKAKATVSMGGAFFPEDADDKVSLIQAADQALYRAKEAGRDRFECCFNLPDLPSEPKLETPIMEKVDSHR
ncbi:diguanylate cyclase [Desulfosarcina sp.]|uniref:GGDEF domain-containing response regulator n=1 Tax=Desulfosarcina sp. TaxID=2027861 RepID=UPI00356B07FA